MASNHIRDDEDSRLLGIVKRRAETRAARRFDKMACPGSNIRARPVLRIARVSKGGGGNEHSVRGSEYFAGQGNGGIDPVTLEPDIDVAAVFALDFEPVDELVLPSIAAERVEHCDPGREDDFCAPLDAAGGCIDATALGRLQFIRAG